MLGTPTLVSPLHGLVTRLRTWPVASQQQARRNAMIAATACAQRRAEREDVADFLDARARPTHLAPSPRAQQIPQHRAQGYHSGRAAHA